MQVAHVVETSAPQTTAATALVKPLPPADSIGSSVRALNVILGQLAGTEAINALRRGDACANVDAALWSPAWEGSRNFRDHFVLNLARHTRDEWRRDVSDAVESQPDFNRPKVIAKALDERLRITLGFAFRFLTPRHVCFLGDALMLAFESEMKPSEFARELASSGSHAALASKEMLDALVLGASGMHRYQPERVMASAKANGYGF
jgi:hypothetical protein